MSVHIGRFLQVLGLLILPIGFGIGMFGNNIRLEVNLLWVGGTVFLLGWLLAKKVSS